MLEARISGFLDKIVLASSERLVPVLPIDIHDREEGTRRTIYAEAGEYKDDQYVAYSDVELIKSAEREIIRSGYIVIVDPAAPVFTSLSPEQSTIATKNFKLIEREL